MRYDGAKKAVEVEFFSRHVEEVASALNKAFQPDDFVDGEQFLGGIYDAELRRFSFEEGEMTGFVSCDGVWQWEVSSLER